MPVVVALPRAEAPAESIQAAASLLSKMRAVACEREVLVARANKAAAAIVAEAEAAVAPLDDALRVMRAEMDRFILVNRHLFIKPRRHKTPDGYFGLQAKSKLDVRNEEALLDFLFDKGYDDCFKAVHSIVKERVRARIEGGEDIPGCIIHQEEVPECKVDEALLKEARSHA